MYRNRKFNKATKTTTAEKPAAKKRALTAIDEDAAIKINRLQSTNDEVESACRLLENAVDVEVFESDENIPASQEPTQRYLSQRSIAASLARTLSRTGSGLQTTQRAPSSYFELVLVKTGVQLDAEDAFILSCDHIAFVSKFRDMLLKAQNYPENLNIFKAGLRDALATKSRLLPKLLSGCTIKASDEDGNSYQSQDSMLINFMMIDFLRNDVLELLLDKIKLVAIATNAQTINNVPLLPLLLTQLRYITQSHGDLIFERIKCIFEQCTETAKWEIIASAELMLDANKHDDFAQLLLDNLIESKDIFHSTTVHTLANLSLSARMQDKLRSKILSYIRDEQCTIANLPALVKFLLKFLDEDNDRCVVELVNTLREILLHRSSSNSNNAQEQKQIQLELFQLIKQSLTRSKKLYYIWQKVISNLAAAQFRSVDFILLLLLVEIKEDNSLFIENILRKRIKEEHITVDILKETETKFALVLEKHTNVLMHMLHDFLKERNKAVADFARSSYGILFKLCASLQKNILLKLLQLTCDKSTENMTNLALELLRALQRNYPKEVQNWGTLLMPLLDRLNEMSLSQTRLVMQILCSVAFPASHLPDCPLLQDQIDMIVKKQMINRLPFIKKQGIIGSVQLVDCIARVERLANEQQSDFNTTYNSVDDLPDGRGKTAANLIMRIHSSTTYCAESLALFYDELASVCAASPADRLDKTCLDKHFLTWLCELMTLYFQNSFVAEHQPNEILGIKLSYQKCINSINDTSELDESALFSIAVNISELVLQPKVEACSSILVLAPLFNLVRVLNLQRFEGSLEQINALLGCAVVLPTCFDNANTDTILSDYDEQLQKKLLDIYFHCVNWFREAVSSFATQREPMIRHKVLTRMADLIKAEDQIRKLLPRAPADYEPPLCQFLTIHSTVVQAKAIARSRPAQNNAKKGGKKANKTAANATVNQTEADTTMLNNISVANNTITNRHDSYRLNKAKPKSSSNSLKINFNNLYGPKENYRQMDSCIMLLLQEKLILDYPMPPERLGECIALPELRFILHDLVMKLESIMGVQKFHSEQSLQYIQKPYYFLSDLSKFLPAIMQNMDMLSQSIKEQLDIVKHIYSHGDLFTSSFCYLKVCFGLSLRLLAAYFSWSEFALEERAELLKASLVAVLSPTQPQTPDLCKKSIAALAKRAFAKFLTYEVGIVELKTAVHLHQLVGTLKRHYLAQKDDGNSLDKINKEIRSLCNTLLSRKWFSYEGMLEKGANCNIYLDELLKSFLKDSNFKRQHDVVRIVIDELKYLDGKDTALKSFPNITKANFPLLFRGFCEILIKTVHGFMCSHQLSNDKLKMWETSCKQLNLLKEILDNSNMPRNYQFYIKYSNIYVKLLLQHGLQMFEDQLRRNPDRVREFLENLQITTRFLHNLCCHSKALKNTGIVSQIPFLRETIEYLVFRVKALLAANKCADVFWMGNLKNKDLQGDIIVSQSDIAPTLEENENSDEELPDDDNSVDETLLDQDVVPLKESTRNGAGGSKTASRSECI